MEFVGSINLAHMEADCEPPGYSIIIGFAGPLGCNAMAKCGPQSVELGEVHSMSSRLHSWQQSLKMKSTAPPADCALPTAATNHTARNRLAAERTFYHKVRPCVHLGGISHSLC